MLRSAPVAALLLALVACTSEAAPASTTPAAATAGGASTASPGSAAQFSGPPIATMASSGGKLNVDVRSAPTQPPARGVQSFQFVITDPATGAPRTGLTLDVVPWMPAMGHGTSLTPSFAEVSPGTYVISDVDLFMPGTWELRTTTSGGVSDQLAPSFDIP